MKRLMVDMDNCITDALFIERVNEFLGTSYNIDDQNDFELQNLTGERKDEFWQYMSDKSFYDNAPLIDGVYDALKLLNERYDLYIVTAYIYRNSSPDISGNNLKYKYEYLKEKLPFIKPEQYIFIDNKNLIEFDIGIDDKMCNLMSSSKKILFDAWHNRNISDLELKKYDIVRVCSWKEILKILNIEKR